MPESMRHAPCPPTHSDRSFPLGDGRGGLLKREVFVPGRTTVQHIPHFGYVSLFPLLLNAINGTSSHIEPAMQLLADRRRVWSPHGLRSLSRQDLYYRRGNAPGDKAYWRGNVWLPINYLALRALSALEVEGSGPSARAGELRVALRARLVRAVLGEWEPSLTLWENYDDQTGAGDFTPGFTGWSSLILLIMTDKY